MKSNILIHKKNKIGAYPVTMKLGSFETLALFLDFAKDGMKSYVENSLSKDGSMIENLKKHIKAIEEFQNDVDERGIEVDAKPRTFEIEL